MSQAPQLISASTTTVHQRIRSGILSIVVATDEADFAYRKTALNISDGSLSRHLDVLAAQRLVTIREGYHSKRPRTWVSISGHGRAAYAAAMAALRQLADRFEQHHDADAAAVPSGRRPPRDQ
ncbi:transcriptional regulator [Actinoplanes sp. CA-030573]|uniref:transcriptional regulator n=1 Tax=Actinoplanes sp. CA-030573 TaxID=3239898 RepID=UPI003D8F518E